MKWEVKAVAVIVGIVLIGSAAYSIYSVYAENGRLTGANKSLTTRLSEQVAINTKQQARIQHLAELETKHIRELDNAKSEIDTLRSDVAAGRRKLRIKAVCPVRETTASGSVGDAGTPQLTEAARQDYYDLLRMMAENERQTKYLQDYANTECYKVKK
ncbi:lysis protein [Xenorhabdus bovienii]|uniref:Putative endopeptidase (Protein gp15) n=1 Tax=Xenorhabdus bovienii TaxID=40576 RepID=A0A0B6XD16_XENBV|nr:lysis protein [Xenorhabdus bovienii]CDG87308.1 putative endopeptidase (Protein gp15) [Xenorhabdus bovienii str. feltiae France]CDG90634.1 putative endopeptidase (Protein gp15) [Xenorhabdus bovienii str. feltiae Florida]CDM90159.1 putative endopeptidase (Protein gp15) [Xenorhabdus bovienii]